MKAVAQELGVATVPRVSAKGWRQSSGERTVDRCTRRHDLWAKSYDRNLEDVLGVESEISQDIADALQAKLSPTESDVLALAGTHDAQAYGSFLER